MNSSLRDAARPRGRPRWPVEEAWRADIWSIGLDRLDYLGVDEKGALYWDGAPIEISRPLTLSWWQRMLALAVSIAAVLGASAACVSAYLDWKGVTPSTTANERRCLAIQLDMLSARPRRADSPDLFQALGCRPQGDGSVYAPRKITGLINR